MCEIDRIKELAKEQKRSLSYICAQIGVANNYLTDIARGKNTLKPDRLAQIADILSTTPEYLRGETDIKEKPLLSEELSDEEYEMLKLWRAAPSDKRRTLALEILKGD